MDAMGASFESAQQKTSETVEKVKDTIQATTETIKSKLGGNSFIIITLFGVVVGAFALAVALYYIIMSAISSSKTYVIPETKVPIIGTQLNTYRGTGIPAASNGKRMTVSFWIYLNDMNVNAGAVRRIFNRGDKDGIDKSSPFVALDGKTNKIHVIFTTTDSVSQYKGVDGAGTQYDFSTQAAAASTSIEDKVSFLSLVHGIQIDYMPMQRWVHVAIVVNEESNGGIIMSYIDGELVKTVGSSTPLGSVTVGGTTVQNAVLNMANLDLNVLGSVNVGSDISSATPGFSGLVSTIGFTNSDLNANDIYSMYLQGPINSYMAKVGLSGYGLQSPIYRIA